MKTFLRFLFVALLLAAAPVFAQETPLGTWKTIDDKTGKVRSLVKIIEVNGELRGKIEKLFPQPEDKANPVCDKCEGVQKDAPFLGFLLLKGFKKGVDGQLQEGEVTDPENGKTYRSRLTLLEGGKKLEVRGYIGAPIFGRSQVWARD